MKYYEAMHIITTFDFYTYLDFPSFEDGSRAHEVEWQRIEIHQIDVAVVGMIGDDLKILQRQSLCSKNIRTSKYKDVHILNNAYCSYLQRCIDAPMKGRY